MNRMDRLFAILVHLQSKRIVTANEIAERFDISIRTVYRDIRALEEAGIPIGSNTGSGYFLVEGYHLPPVMFTTQEASALITAEKFMEKFTDNSLKEYFNSALFKIKAILKKQDKDYLERLQSKIEVYPVPESGTSAGGGFMTDIQFALSSKRVLNIQYHTSYSPQSIKRNIEPLILGFFELHWHLIAFCRLRKKYRDFRLDRIEKLSITEETFPDKRQDSIQKILMEMLSYKHLHQVILQFDKSVSYDRLKTKCIFGLIEEKDLGDKVEITLLSDSLEVLGNWLLNYISGVEIISPPELKMIMQNYASSIAIHYRNLT